MLIVGEGEEKDAIEEKARRLEIENDVILTGVRNDVYDLLQAMDVFVFPSLKEGLPVTLIEAQATKLRALFPILCPNTQGRTATWNIFHFPIPLRNGHRKRRSLHQLIGKAYLARN